MRHIVVLPPGVEGERVLDESAARNEDELQQKLRNHPELLPVEELDVGTAALVVGRESRLPSGRPDLLAISDQGDLIIVEMKTGPENSDFRRALAQLLDYGSDLWQMSLDKFEADIAVPYFNGTQCPEGASGRGAKGLSEAIADWLDEGTSSEPADLLVQLDRDLRTGAFTYVLAAQSLTPSMERAIEYLNATMKDARFYGVELVKFEERDGGPDGFVAYEARTVVRPSAEKLGVQAAQKEQGFLDRFDGAARTAAARVVDVAEGLGMTVFYGSVGASLKIDVPRRSAPLSVAWLYPPGHNGIHGSRNFAVGYVTKMLDDLPESRPRLQALVANAATLTGAEAVPGAGLDGYMMSWENVADQLDAVLEMLEDVATGSTG